jgi:FkbM family methyltransferase
MTPTTGMLYDVGANIGLYTLVFAANRLREVVSFEPSPLVLPLLHANVAGNRLDRVRVIPMALSDRSGLIRFALDRVTTNTSHVAQESEPGVSVASIDLDSWLAAQSVRPPDLIKLDVEGHDGPVLHGMADVLRHHRPIVCLEGGLRDADGRVPGLAFLARLGYQLWDLDRARRLDPWTGEYVVLGVP